MNERRIIIEENGKPVPVKKPEKPSEVDLQDRLLVAGILLGEVAALVIWWPSALILGCLFCFGFAYLIEQAKAKEAKIEAAKEAARQRRENGNIL